MEKLKRIIFTSLAPCVLLLLASCVDHNPPDDCLDCATAKTAYDYFVDISAIPRCSGNEGAASDYLAAFGRSLGLDEPLQDSARNVLIRKRGSRGRENEPPVILQAHIDMVCVKDPDDGHDFSRDPIILDTIDGDWATARGKTTLGADNGSGVSMIMAVLASNSLSHPPIEALLTTEEETGMVGADSFDVSRLNGRRLINLDMVKESVIVVSNKWDGGSFVIVPIETAALLKVSRVPDWPYKAESPLRDKAAAVFKDFYGEAPVIAGINNAGVECAVFAAKMPDADMISIGPDIVDIHTPNERMSISSHRRVYDYLVKLLGEL
jgi:di/tripeptidase